MGLGLREDQLWRLTPRQVEALRKCWHDMRQWDINTLAILRAELRNAWTPKKSGQAWTPEEFGAVLPSKKWKHPRSTYTPETLQAKCVQMWGPEGKGRKKDGGALAQFKKSGGQVVRFEKGA